MTNRVTTLLGALATVSVLASVAVDGVAQSGFCSGELMPWGAKYDCGTVGTVEARDFPSPFPGVVVPRLIVNKVTGRTLEARGLDADGNPIAGCFAFDSVADGVPESDPNGCGNGSPQFVNYFGTR